MRSLASYVVDIAFKADTKKVQSFNKALSDTGKTVTALTGIFSTGSYFINKYIQGIVSNTQAISEVTRQTGLAVKSLNEYASAGSQISPSLDTKTIIRDIGNLEERLARIRMFGGDISSFQRLNISSLEGNAFDILRQIKEGITDLTDLEATILIKDIGLNPEFLQVLRLTDAEFNKLSKNNFLNAKGIKTINEVNLGMKRLTTSFITLKDQALIKLAPEFNKLISDSLGWIQKNQTKIIGAISGIVEKTKDFIIAIGNAGGLIAKFAENTFGAENGLKTLAYGIALSALAIRPFLLGMTALVILLDDIMGWQEGKDSLFGGFYEAISKIPNISVILGGAATLLFLSKLTKGFGAIGLAVSGLTGKLGLLLAGFTLLTGISRWIEGLVGGDGGKLAGVATRIGGAALLGGAIGGPFGAAIGGTGAAGVEGLNYLLERLSSNEKSSNTNINNTFQIDVNSTSDSGKVIGEEIRQEMLKMQNEFISTEVIRK